MTQITHSIRLVSLAAFLCASLGASLAAAECPKGTHLADRIVDGETPALYEPEAMTRALTQKQVYLVPSREFVIPIDAESFTGRLEACVTPEVEAPTTFVNFNIEDSKAVRKLVKAMPNPQVVLEQGVAIRVTKLIDSTLGNKVYDYLTLGTTEHRYLKNLKISFPSWISTEGKWPQIFSDMPGTDQDLSTFFDLCISDKTH